MFCVSQPMRAEIIASYQATSNFYRLAEWVPTYVSKQYGGLVCINEVQLSLDETGKVQLKASMLLSATNVDDSKYTVQVVGKNTDIVSCKDVGYKVKALVTENASGTSCWSFVLVEDKLKPNVLCRDTTVLCTGTLKDLDSIPGLIAINDNCTPNQYLTINHLDKINTLDCSNDTFSIVTRSWTATDPWGRTGSCVQKISLLKPRLSDIVFPKDTTVYCPNTTISSSVTGQPTIHGKALDKFCGWVVKNDDQVFNKCGTTKKILRTWNILNCCSIKDTTVIQFIVIADTTRPVITCRLIDSVNTSPNQCGVDYVLKPVLSVSDACNTSGIVTLIQIDNAYYGLPNSRVNLSVGIHSLVYEVSDPCGNKSTCSSVLQVKDKQKPVLWCPDSLQISLPAQVVHLPASTFNSISVFDNCALLHGISMRRTVDNCVDGVDDTQFKDTVAVCCADINKPFDFVFLSSDINGNKDSCHVRVNVVDKSAPQLNCTQDTTVNCLQSRPTLLDPALTLYDNCRDSVKIKIDTLINAFNICGIGQIKRRVVAVDLSNNRDTCFQTIKVVNVDTLLASNILQAHDTIKIVGCADSLITKGHIGYEPPLVSAPTGGCHRIFVIPSDVSLPTAGTSRCKITKRTWSVGDTCLSLIPVTKLIQIIIQDTTAFSPLAGPITGNIHSLTGIPIENVHVLGKNSAKDAVYTQMTDRDGIFKYTSSMPLSSLSLDKVESEVLNGISTLDLIKIQRHISGTKALTHPIDLYAADVNGDGEINVLDLVQIRKYILGLDFTHELTWKFVKDNISLDQIHPGMTLDNEFNISVQNEFEKFIGFRMGDINHDAQYTGLDGLETRASSTILKMDQKASMISFSLNQSIDAYGIQLSLTNDAGWEGATFESTLTGIQFIVKGKELRINWYQPISSRIPAGGHLFNINIAHSGNISHGTLRSEWYDLNLQSNALRLINTHTHQGSGTEVKVYPNPVVEVLHIDRLNSTLQRMDWNILDQTGKTVIKGTWPADLVSGAVSTTSLPAGIYILQTRGEDGWISRQKFIKAQ
jgi:hypothetical protein